MNILVFANGFDGSKRMYNIGAPLGSDDMNGILAVPNPKRTDAVGFSCYAQAVIAVPDKGVTSVRIYVILVSKNFAPEIDNFGALTLDAALNSLGLTFIDDKEKNYNGIPMFILQSMREDAMRAAVGMMQQQAMDAAMAQQMGGPQLATPPAPRLVVPG